ncbi:hypothetical protein VZ119_06605 [Enterobacter bugandensis]|uniref:Uncharacterized protein n=1 Tax=Enterobacter bugandensis TaxID=881260 RepID=A0A822WXR8_9ENTR|nr:MULTISPECIES: hypothetical protein [Enterobacter]MBE3208713.1 hypothetical protein [Enterobacter cloacae complex sp. P32C]MBY6300204.1 hypothetical protein [Enterobacter bugandensis]MCK7078945.1 hypothetical protein [Enterobacter bugandensis]MCK7374847.1 hypothetical protein [Enterobacter bugandensis]MCK7399734.1 hypothetical protein [Enterobacter bugandensis]
MNKTLIATLVGITMLTGCGPQELTPEQKQEVAALKTELSQTEGEILAAKEVDQQFSGGLIKNLTTARLEVLGTNKALLEQRINAIESGAKIDVVVSGTKPDPELAASIKTEIDNLTAKINEAKADASQYTGGLIQVLKLSAVATEEQSMAMLQQKYLTAKYGLAEVKLAPIQDSAATASDKKEATAKTTQEQPPLLPPAEGPFGLEAGLTQKNIEDMIGAKLKPLPDSVNLYTSDKLPKQNADFEMYGLLISPKAGLCQIRAVGKNIDTDSYGLALKSRFEDLSSSLSSLYGKAETTDLLLAGSIWKEPQDWMMGLNKKERFLSATWKGTKETPLKNNIGAISIEARANSSAQGYVYLQYTFTNDDVCQAEIEGAKKSSL